MRGPEHGFTLVELSIVLVIVGLIAGGVLVAQSMIAAANVAATVKQIQQFDAGVENFRTKYNSLPGDSTLFGGDGDGIITRSNFSAGVDGVDFFECEIANFWAETFPDQYAASPCPGPVPPATKGAGKNVPLSRLGSNGSFFIASASASSSTSAYANPSIPQNYYAIFSGAHFQASNQYIFYAPSTEFALKPVEALSLDTKMDDGRPDQGAVISGSVSSAPDPGVTGGLFTAPLSGCSTGPTYNVGTSGYQCTPVIRIGAQTGDSQ